MSTKLLSLHPETERKIQRIIAAINKGLAASSPQMLLALEMLQAGYQLAKAEQPEKTAE